MVSVLALPFITKHFILFFYFFADQYKDAVLSKESKHFCICHNQLIERYHVRLSRRWSVTRETTSSPR